MTSLSVPAARHGDTTLTLQEFLRREHQRGRLLPRLRRAAREAFALEQARALGLCVGDSELQHAADLFRRRRQLPSAARTHAWLAERELSVDDLEAGLESDLLLRKLEQHVTSPERVAQRFQAAAGQYERWRVRRMLVAREDLARELHCQLTEEGASFADLAKQHSLLSGRNDAGATLCIFRFQLPAAVKQAAGEARPGAVLGPMAASHGFWLVHVEEVTPATLDAQTVAVIGRQIFDEWLAERLTASPFSACLLGHLA